MDTDLISSLQSSIGSYFAKHADGLTRTFKFVKTFLVLGGSVLAGIAGGFLDKPYLPLTTPEMLIVFAALASFLGGVIDLLFNKIPAKALEDARQALEIASKTTSDLHESTAQKQAYERTIIRLQELYVASTEGRAVLERGDGELAPSLEKEIQDCLDVCSVSLRQAIGFETGDFWTLSVFRAERRGDGSRELCCVALDREIRCDPQSARRWPEGVGVGGICLARGDEVTVEDILDPSVGNAFTAPKTMVQDHDVDRYRSMCAVPIYAGTQKDPWGVVLGTSSRPSHFGRKLFVGVAPEEGIRLMAGLTALLVATHARLTEHASVVGGQHGEHTGERSGNS